MNSPVKSLFFSSIAAIVLILSACGGGGAGSIGGIDGSGAPVYAGTVSTGAINGFGSVIVNGVRYNSDKATILINEQEQPGDDSLHVGYQVKVTGKLSSDGTSTADTIEFHPNLIGSVSQIDLSTQEFTVLNHQVRVNNATLFDAAIQPNFLSGLKIGDTVLVSGFVDDTGVIIATRVELTATANRQVMGLVSNLTQTSFTVKNQSVNYGAATLIKFSNNVIEANNLVAVTGVLDDKGVLQAKTIVRITNSFSKDIKTVESEGFITRYVSATDFDVAGVTWATNAQTSFENGTITNLAQGVALSIKGELNASGQLVAQKVEFKKISTNEIAGEVTAVSILNNGIIPTGTLQISGTTIQTNVRTAFEDKGSATIKRFNLSGVNVGDFLKVSGYTYQGNFIATKVEREDVQKGKDITLKVDGIILNIDLHSFTLYGRTIVTNSQTEFKDTKGEKITETQFYLLALGQRVRVEGILKNGIFTAQKIELTGSKGD